MKILIIGGGSIGQRHALNALSLADEVALFDLDSGITQKFADEHDTAVFATLDEALAWNPDGAVIAAPHKFHIELATQVIKAGITPLIEKPLSHALEGVDEFLELVSNQSALAYVVCNMRFHQAINVLRDNLSRVGNMMYTRAQYGNYLPNMRPDADYKKLYCAHKDQGGGVILDAIHEINYLRWLFGDVESVLCQAEKRSDLDIDVEDYAALNLKHESGVCSEVHLDYLQQCKRRGCEIVGRDGTLIWESAGKNPEHCLVRFYDADTKTWEILYEDHDLDMAVMYKGLMEAFIEQLKDPSAQSRLSSAQEAFEDLKVCMAAHDSAASGSRKKV